MLAPRGLRAPGVTVERLHRCTLRKERTLEQTSVEFVVDLDEAEGRVRRSATELTGWESVVFELGEDSGGD